MTQAHHHCAGQESLGAGLVQVVAEKEDEDAGQEISGRKENVVLGDVEIVEAGEDSLGELQEGVVEVVADSDQDQNGEEQGGIGVRHQLNKKAYMKIQNLFQTQRTSISVAKQIQELTLRQQRLLHKVNELKKKRFQNKLKGPSSLSFPNPESSNEGSKQLTDILNKSIQIQRKKRVKQLHIQNFSRSREARKLIQEKKREIASLQSKQSKLHEQRKMLQKQAFLCQKKQYCLEIKRKEQQANRKIERFINQYTQRAIIQKHQQQAIFKSMKQERKSRIEELSRLEESLLQNLKKSDKVLRSSSKMIA